MRILLLGALVVVAGLWITPDDRGVRFMVNATMGLTRYRYPSFLINAPMANVTDGAVASAVASAGALGLIGGGYGDADWIRAQLARRRVTTSESV